MSDEKGVGSLPDAGTIKPGAPGHIEDHDEMARLMQVAADALGITLDPPPPPPAVIGEYGHVQAHNTLLANIEQLAEAGGGGLPGELPGIGGWATMVAVTGTGTKYEYTADGLEWSAWEFTEDGTFTVGDEDGLIEFLLVASATRHSGSDNGGKGGAVLAGLEMSDAATTTSVTVGKTADAANYGAANGSSPSFLTHDDGEILFAGSVGDWSSPFYAGNGGMQANGTGVFSSMFGTQRGFGGGATTNGHPYGVNPAVPNSGAASIDNAQSWPNGAPQNNGVVGIRVPKLNDKTGMAAGPFTVTTVRDKAKQKIRDKHTSPVTQEIKE